MTDKNKEIGYIEFLEKLKIEFGDFLCKAESGRVVRNSGLKSRTKSLKLRDMLKQFRIISLRNDKKIAKIMENARKKIQEEIV